ncbi:hypothetical protein ACH5RR_010118 [Cinchona calisaya]|uniref:C2H2-type domain-containing protein n=1 Tax=Cinchona calisaya TaxID=153742 RepID=A0ABD3AG76_9GENT
MEMNQQPTSQSQGGGNSEEEEGRLLSSPTTTQQLAEASRLYECSFCKKGFSNAQALGGHMNIHRKDKAAKLKHQSSSFSSPKTASKNHNRLLHDAQGLTPLTPSNIDLKQLPLLFVETADAYSNSNIIQDNNSASCQEEFISGGGQGLYAAELDLELRLGPRHEPPKSSVSIGTRKFF